MFDLGIRSKDLREKVRWSQEDLGRKVNKSKSTISLYENDGLVPPGDTLIEMASLFNVSLDYLVGIDKNEMVSIDKLTEQQKTMVHTLIVELQDTTKSKTGLSPRQQDILCSLIKEFAEKNIR